MKMSEIQQMTLDELRGKLAESREEFLHWQDQIFSGKEKNYKKAQLLKRDIARILTAMRKVAQTGNK